MVVWPTTRVPMRLAARAWLAIGSLIVVLGMLLFAAAGTLDYWQAWVYLGIIGMSSSITTLDLLKRDPALLERRMRAGPTAEQRGAQKIIMAFTSIGFGALVLVPALDRRFAWSRVPTNVVIAGDILVAIGFFFIFFVYRENTFTAATVQVAEGQTVVSTGPYALVRHPMYASALLYLGGTPIALGSYWGLVAFTATIPFLIWRILDEERLLAADLPGYTEYQRRVRYRLMPMVW
jgi:protein-S-isoprenylcysteine O-methyltransferase Ste14